MESQQPAPIMQEILRNPKQLVAGSLTSDSLKSILLGLCTLIQNQQGEIEKLRAEIEQRPTTELMNKTVFNNMHCNDVTINSISEDLSTIHNNVADLVETVNKYHMESMSKCSTVQANLEEAKSSITLQFQSRTTQLNTKIDQVNLLIPPISAQITEFSNEILTLRELFNKSGFKSFDSLAERVVSVEQRVAEFQNIPLTMKADIDALSTSTQASIQMVQSTLSDQIAEIKVKASEVKPAPAVTFQPPTQQESESLTNVVQRNSRRLDAIDEMISSLRMANEKSIEDIKQFEETIQGFNRRICDFENYSDGIAADFLGRFQSLQPFFEWNGVQLRDIWSSLTDIGGAVNGFLSFSKNLEEMIRLLSDISTKPLPNIASMVESISDMKNIYEKLREKKGGLDFQRQMLSLASVFKKIDGKKKKVKVEEESGVNERLNQIEEQFAQLRNIVDVSEQEVKNELRSKVDAEQVERVFVKVQRSVDTLNRKVSSIGMEEAKTPMELKESKSISSLIQRPQTMLGSGKRRTGIIGQRSADPKNFHTVTPSSSHLASSVLEFPPK